MERPEHETPADDIEPSDALPDQAGEHVDPADLEPDREEITPVEETREERG
jgi:hypothetical protein